MGTAVGVTKRENTGISKRDNSAEGTVAECKRHVALATSTVKKTLSKSRHIKDLREGRQFLQTNPDGNQPLIVLNSEERVCYIGKLIQNNVFLQKYIRIHRSVVRLS